MTLEAPYGNRKTGEQRLTKGCRRVLAALEQMDNLTSAQDIHGMLRQSAPEAPGLTTVYRSLDSLVALGLVQSVDIGDGEKRYELVVPGEHHHHLICQHCRASIHLDECLVANLEQSIMSQYGFVIRHHVLEVFGLCANCAEMEMTTK